MTGRGFAFSCQRDSVCAMSDVLLVPFALADIFCCFEGFMRLLYGRRRNGY